MGLLVQSSPPTLDTDLSERELDVLKLVAQGLIGTQIAVQLGISHSTVRFHLCNILNKLKVTTKAEAIVIAAKYNLLL